LTDAAVAMAEPKACAATSADASSVSMAEAGGGAMCVDVGGAGAERACSKAGQGCKQPCAAAWASRHSVRGRVGTASYSILGRCFRAPPGTQCTTTRRARRTPTATRRTPRHHWHAGIVAGICQWIFNQAHRVGPRPACFRTTGTCKKKDHTASAIDSTVMFCFKVAA
jgi:hypothetical protein